MQQFIESMKVASRAVIAVVVLVCASLLLAGAASAKPLDPECVGYMEADAIYEEAIAATEPSGILAPVSEGLLGASKEIEAARQDAESKRLQAYSKAYKGPRSTETEYTIMLIVEDVGRCSLDRFFLEEGIDMEYSEQEGLADLLNPLGLIEPNPQ